MRLIWRKSKQPLLLSYSMKRIMKMMPSGIPLAGELRGVPLLDKSRVSSRVIATLRTMVYMDILDTAHYAEEEIVLKLNQPLGIDVEMLVRKGVAELIEA